MVAVPNRWLVTATILAALVIALGAAWNPLATTLVVIAVYMPAMLYIAATRTDRIFAISLVGLLIGYAFLGKGFAYLGVHPVYIGEIVLAIGCATAAIRGGIRLAFRSATCWWVLAFGLWGVIRTIPYIGIYQTNAIRDGVIWGYGTFAILVAAFLLRTRLVETVPRFYAKYLPFLLLWYPLALLLELSVENFIPRVPGTEASLLDLKSGDVAVHLAGAVAFLLLGLRRMPSDGTQKQSSDVRGAATEMVLWVLLLFGVVLVSANNRGGLLALLIAAAIAIPSRPLNSLGRIAIAVSICAVLVLSDFQIDYGSERGRQISLSQIGDNIASIFVEKDVGDLNNTRQWRIDWWNTIIDYTVRGDYFFTGKGFGINLADDDGFQVSEDHSLRSPHNGHLTILARAGVPGFALWTCLQASFVISLLRAFLVARRKRNVFWERVNLWILCYWAAFMVNGAFDVFLEGPQGGIWFWSWFGFGIAAVVYQRRQERWSVSTKSDESIVTS